MVAAFFYANQQEKTALSEKFITLWKWAQKVILCIHRDSTERKEPAR